VRSSNTLFVRKELLNSSMHSGIQTLGLLCMVDLFPVPPQSIARDSSGTHNLISLTQPPLPSAGPTHVNRSAELGGHTTFTFVPNEYPMKQPSVEPSPQPQHRIPGFLPPSSSAPDVIHHVNDFPVTESSKMTHALVGATFAQPAIVEYQGKKTVVFVFAVSFEPIAFPWVRLTFLLIYRTSQLKPRVISSFDTEFLTSFRSHVIIPT